MTFLVVLASDEYHELGVLSWMTQTCVNVSHVIGLVM